MDLCTESLNNKYIYVENMHSHMHSTRHEHINVCVVFMWACKFQIHLTRACIETVKEHYWQMLSRCLSRPHCIIVIVTVSIFIDHYASSLHT